MGAVEQYGGGAQILDEVFGPSWGVDVLRGRSAKSIYDKIITIGAGFGNNAYVRLSGNDSTGIVGNILFPFQTIGAAITALGTLPNSALVIDDPGTYILNDTNAPFGLKAPGSKYDIYAAAGVTIQYYGTYGMYCADGNEGTAGNIFGFGDFINYATVATKLVGGVNGYAFNVANLGNQYTYEFNRILSEPTITTMAGLSRIGQSIGFLVFFKIIARSYSRTGFTLLLDTSCNVSVNSIFAYGVGIDQVGSGEAAIKIVNPTNVMLNNLSVAGRGQAFGATNTKCMVIDNAVNGRIVLNNLFLFCTSSPAGYRMIDLPNAPAIMDNLIISKCLIKSRDRSSFTSNGFSFFSNNNTSFKIIDTYAEKNTGGAGIITNLIGAGSGFQVDANL